MPTGRMRLDDKQYLILLKIIVLSFTPALEIPRALHDVSETK